MNQNQKSFNVPQTGKFVCRSSVRMLQEQSNSNTDNIKLTIQLKRKENRIKLTYIVCVREFKLVLKTERRKHIKVQRVRLRLWS